MFYDHFNNAVIEIKSNANREIKKIENTLIKTLKY